jgi:DNA polymerase III delta subunit
MPRFEPKAIQKELEQNLLWPVYWIYGGERMKARELLKRIRRVVVGETAAPSGQSLGEESFDASECDSGAILDAAQSPSLLGGARFIVIRDAHALTSPEALEPLFGPRSPKEELTSVCVFLSKDLDGRKKFSKTLLEKAAVVPCEEVQEHEREPWIQYLAKLRGVTLSPAHVLQLSILDPWTLEIVDQELEKYVVSGSDEEAFLKESQLQGGGDAFVEVFFRRNLRAALERVESFADQPDESLPLLGLLAWNARHLGLVISERERKTGTLKLNPYVAERMQNWARLWSLDEVVALQEELAEVDFGFKQTPLIPLGLWGSLVMRFCREQI